MPIGLDPIATYAFHVNVDASPSPSQGGGRPVHLVGVIEHRSNTGWGTAGPAQAPGTVKFENIVLSRGKVNDAALDLDQAGAGRRHRRARRDGSVILFDYAHGQVSKFDFKQGWPCKVELGKLQAATDTVLLETVTITHERLELG
jgi:phage tail-like protein